MIEGRCLCGAVTVRVEGALGDISACHCENCRRWSGSVQMGVEVERERVTMAGPVKVHQSTGIAERAWCDTCGSAVWFAYTAGRDTGYLELAPGLFDNFGGAKVVREVYADRCPEGMRLADVPERVSKADYERDNPSV